MIEREPLNRDTHQLIADGLARQEALSKVDKVLAGVTGTAHDNNGTIEITVDGRGKLKKLWLAPAAVQYGADRLGGLIVEVAQVAMQDATQNGYNKVALLLGDNLTYAMEQLSGRAAPARADRADGITAEEFQRRRDERLRDADHGTDTGGHTPKDLDDLGTFDPSSLRSDR